MSFLQGPFQTVRFVLDKVNVIGTCFLLQGNWAAYTWSFWSRCLQCIQKGISSLLGGPRFSGTGVSSALPDEGGGAEVS